MARTRLISISCIPDEVLELIASQLVLTFHDVVAFSSTSQRIHAATKFLIATPLYIEDPAGTEKLDLELANPGLGLVRSAIIDTKFTLAQSQPQSEQLRQLICRAPRLRYLSLRRPAPDPLEFTPRYEPSRSKTAAHPFPLRSSHFQNTSRYLGNLTHLELCGLSMHPFLFSRFPNLTHLKLSLAGQRDAYLATDALNIVAAARGCKLVGFEIGLHVGIEPRERLSVVKACIAAWPNLETLNLLSAENNKIPSLFDRWQKPETLVPSATELAKALEPAQQLRHLSLGTVPLDAESLSSSVTPLVPPQADPAPAPGSLAALATLFRTTCPELETVRCPVPLGARSGKRAFTEFYQVARARWVGEGWECAREDVPEGSLDIFGMTGRA
ncbi:hypothetical protein FRC08_003315 [Ceratobasidium sp. 394]|nr:hypothetical protein FRC08_003315 [Ceratobasidium sp. 394]